jgi:flagellar biosynthetic protein FlhB
MAEKGTESGSAQHRQKARQKGDSVRSRELTSACAMMAGIVVLGIVSKPFVAVWGNVFEQCLDMASAASVLSDQHWLSGMRNVLAPALLPVGTVMIASFAGALAVGVAQGGGLSIYPGAIGLKFDKLSPMANIGHMFSLRSATRIVKSLVPAAAMVVCGWYALKSLMLPMPVMSLMRLPTALGTAYSLAVDAAWITLVWSGLDYAVEWVSWNNRMKMTKQQLKDEMKEAMGNPQTKMRVRQAQNAMRRRKVKADISKASVVITNPTHYAVALEFSFDTMQAPTVLAKGRDLHAAEIREEARWAGVPLIENAPLARSLYRAVEPGQAIPFELYAAVAGILAYLYRQKVEERMREERQKASRAAEAQRTRRPMPPRMPTPIAGTPNQPNSPGGIN